MAISDPGGVNVDGVTLEINASGQLQVKDGAVSLSLMDTPIKNAIPRSMVDIRRLQVEAALTPADHAGAALDVFSDSDGADGTVVTGDSTMEYDSTNKVYRNVGQLNQEGSVTHNNTSSTTVATHDFSADPKKITKVEVNHRTTNSNTNGYSRVKFNYSDATSSTTSEDQMPAVNQSETVTWTNPNPSKLVSSIEIQQRSTNGSYDVSHNWSRSYGYGASGVTVKIALPTISGTVSHIAAYQVSGVADADFGTVDITDGSTTLSAQDLDSKIDVSSLAADPTHVTFKSTTGEAVDMTGYVILIWTA